MNSPLFSLHLIERLHWWSGGEDYLVVLFTDVLLFIIVMIISSGLYSSVMRLCGIRTGSSGPFFGE